MKQQAWSRNDFFRESTITIGRIPFMIWFPCSSRLLWPSSATRWFRVQKVVGLSLGVVVICHFSLFVALRLPSGARKPKNRNSSTACLSMKLVMRSWTRFRVSCVDVFNLTHHRIVAERQSACERVGKAHFCGQIKACDYHRSVTWSASSKGHRRRPTENRWNCKRLHFLSRLPTTRPAT